MITALVYLVIYLIVIGLVMWLLNYLIDTIPVPEPFNRIGKIVILVIGVLIVIALLLQLVGGTGTLHLNLPR